MTAVAQLVAPRRALPIRYVVGAQVRRGIGLLIKAAFALAVLAALAPVALVILGYQPSILHTAAMEPTITSGDVVINEGISPGAVRVGDVVTHSNGTGDGSITERVLTVEEVVSGYAFTTMADTGGATTRWLILANDEVTRVAFEVPALGQALAEGKAFAAGSTLAPAAMGLLLAIVLVRTGAAIRNRRGHARFW
ncbi:MAG: S26 family signal peptidase [Acidimicrobiales bacterium]